MKFIFSMIVVMTAIFFFFKYQGRRSAVSNTPGLSEEGKLKTCPLFEMNCICILTYVLLLLFLPKAICDTFTALSAPMAIYISHAACGFILIVH